MTYYDSGVGAIGLYPGISNKLLEFFDNKLGGAWGAGFEANIEQAVNFLSINFAPGDDVYVFGFSRGASQARGLTQFLDLLGGVPPCTDAYSVPLLFRHYLATKGKGDRSQICSSKDYVPSDNVIPLKIRFPGVWDTVMALGSRFKAASGTSETERSFHTKAELAPIVCTARLYFDSV